MVLLPFSALAQSTEEVQIKASVAKLFTAMQLSDSASVVDCFAPNAILQTLVSNKEGQLSVRTENVLQFAASIGKSEKGSLDERIQWGSVQWDGTLAAVFTPYRFYFKGNFIHCGANSFQLIQLPSGWKIQYLIDTRRKVDCKEW